MNMKSKLWILKTSCFLFSFLLITGCSEKKQQKKEPSQTFEKSETSSVDQAVKPSEKEEKKKPGKTKKSKDEKFSRDTVQSEEIKEMTPEDSKKAETAKGETAKTSETKATEKEETKDKEGTKDKSSEKPKRASQKTKQAKSSTASNEKIKETFSKLQQLSLKELPEWIQHNAALNVMRGRAFGKKWKNLTKVEQSEFSKTWAKFVSVNVESFLPLLKDYVITKVESCPVSEKITIYKMTLENKASHEFIEASVMSARNLRIIDITVQDISLISLLQEAITSIFEQKGGKVENWTQFLKKEISKKSLKSSSK